MFASPGPKGAPPPPPSTKNIAEAIATYGAGHGHLWPALVEHVGAYLGPWNYFTLVGTATRVPLHGTTSEALHLEIMAIGAPFQLVLTDLREGEIMDEFLFDCGHLVSCTIHAPEVTRIGDNFLAGCTSLASFDTSGLISVTAIGEVFLAHCTSLASFDTSGLTSVTAIGGSFLAGCTSLLAPPTVEAIIRQSGH